MSGKDDRKQTRWKRRTRAGERRLCCDEHGANLSTIQPKQIDSISRRCLSSAAVEWEINDFLPAHATFIMQIECKIKRTRKGRAALVVRAMTISNGIIASTPRAIWLAIRSEGLSLRAV